MGGDAPSGLDSREEPSTVPELDCVAKWILDLALLTKLFIICSYVSTRQRFETRTLIRSVIIITNQVLHKYTNIYFAWTL